MSKKNNSAEEKLNSSPPPADIKNAKQMNKGALMVCVTGQRSCERLIEKGAYERREGQELYVVHCVQEGKNFLNQRSEPDAIEYLYTCASIIDAELAILRANNVIDALVEFAETHGITRIILGASQKQTGDSFAARLGAKLNNVEFIIVD